MKRISRMAAVIGSVAILAIPPFSVATASDGLGSNEELSKCLNDGDRGLAVLFLVDTSQSLKKKDPRNERVEALQGALRALDSVADSRQIHVEFLDFGSKAERSFPDLSPWSDYDEVKSGLPERVKEYEDRNTAEDTDYADALQKAAETFDGAPDGECQLLAWFTDGELEIDFQETPKTLDWATPPFEVNSEADQDEGKKKAEEAICDPEGFADNLRPPVDGDLTDGGAFIAAVPFVDGNEKDFDFLNKVVTNPDEDCGERPASGSMVLTEDFDQLTSALIRGVDPAPSAATVDDVPLESNERCSAPLNPDSPGAFNLPSSVESIRMRTETPSTKVVPVLLGPFGDDVDPLRFDKPGTKDVADGALVSISKLSPLMTNVDFVLPETVGAWSGVWELRFCAEPDQIPGSGTVEVLEVAGTVGAKLITEIPVIRGESGTATIQLVGGDKQRLRSDALGATKWLMTASDDIELSNRLQDNGTIRSEFDVPADFESDQMVLDLELAPAVEVFPPEKIWPIDIGNIELGAIEIKDPPDYPTIGEPKVSFGVLDQENLKAEISLPVMANGPDSGGSVRLKGATVEGPGDPSYYTIVVTIDDIERQANDPVSFKAGDKGDIKVEIEIDEAAARIDGDVEVDLIFVSTSEKDPDQSGEFPFPSIPATVAPIFNTEAPDAGTLTGLLLLALLTPLLGL
ncbi:MAG: VWA domain-containing protein, partial [Ilumatobacter sp.]|nr:VWA domain-containing protein [Ilumatobacter sp.]